MALCVDDRILCCATAAGPALEGVGISRGMAACTGAVAHVSSAGKDIALEVIGGETATGFCGSGIIDAVALLLDLGAIDETGRIETGQFLGAIQTNTIGDQNEITFLKSGLGITQKDIRAVQLAKSALYAGILTICHRGGIKPEEIQSLYLAGGLGVGIFPNRAERIGLLPAGLSGRAIASGNTAGIGAGEILLNPSSVKQIDEIVQKAEVIDLGTDAYFSEHFMMGMMFPG